MTAVAIVTATVATVPHYTWVTSGGGGTAPFSAIEIAVLFRIWRPVLDRMTDKASIGFIMFLIALSWLVFAAVIAIAWVRIQRRRTLSIIGVAVVTTLASMATLWLVRVISPLTLPW